MKKVIVVGGGVSGLACAKRLVDSGKFEVKLLEATSRVGGRVETFKFGEHFIENGAQWVHGEEGNKVFEMANSMKLLSVQETDMKLTADTVFVTRSGKTLDKKTTERISQILGKILDGPEENEVEGSVGGWAENKFKQVVGDTQLDPNDKGLEASLLDWIHRLQVNIDGADSWFQSSLRGQHEYWECEGNPTIAWKAPACYSSFLGIILNNKPLLAPTFQPEIPSWIVTDKTVVKIEVLPSEAQQPVRVECSDNTKYTCDHLITTVSLGVLKFCHKTLFCPPLPAKKVLAIENLGIGCVNKLHFDFKKKWWPDDILGFNFLWGDDENMEQYWRSEIDEATLAKNVDGFPLWCRNILGFYRISSHPTALNSWITGPAAQYIEKMTDDEVKSMFMKVCRQFVRDYEIPEPEEFCRSSWFSNPNTRGSYSFRQMSSEKTDVWASDLAAPILNKSCVPVLCFAGEATHDHFYSTVHGAYESGLREADRLIGAVTASN